MNSTVFKLQNLLDNSHELKKKQKNMSCNFGAYMRHCVDTEMKRKGGGHPNRPGVSKHSLVGEMGQTFVGMAWDL